MSPSPRYPLSHLLTDSVLRRWVWARLRGQWQDRRDSPPALLHLGLPQEQPCPLAWPDRERPPVPSAPLALPLPGGALVIPPDQPGLAFDHYAQDPVIAPALHGFAWATGQSVPPAWSHLLVQEWLRRYADAPLTSAAWGADVTALRVPLLLDLVARGGWGGSMAHFSNVLIHHLERLSPDGTTRDLHPLLRGWALLRLAVALRMPATLQRAGAFLLEQAEALIRPSGILNLGSTHWHMVLTRALADSWLTLCHHQAVALATPLEPLVRRLVQVLPALTLSGGMPLVGEICAAWPLTWAEWRAGLSEEDRDRLDRLVGAQGLSDLEKLRQDGWLRYDRGPWQGLWHCPPGGWLPADSPTHHQDQTGFEVHYQGVPIFIDPGAGDRRAPELMAAAAGHNAFLVNGADPYPVNRLCYSPGFQRELCGPAPQLRSAHDGVSLRLSGYGWQGGPKELLRRWTVLPESLKIEDYLPGTGRCAISRRLITPLAVTRESESVVRLEDGAGLVFRLEAEQHPIAIGEGRRSTSDGGSAPVTVLDIGQGTHSLPWLGHITVTRITA